MSVARLVIVPDRLPTLC